MRVVLMGFGAAFWLSFAAPIHAAESPIVIAQDKSPSTNSGSSDKSDDLSERLNQSGGVIKPPQNVDPGLQKPPPDTAGKMPVIPPPGSPGGDPNVKPK